LVEKELAPPGGQISVSADAPVVIQSQASLRVDAELIRAPFSEVEIAERLAKDPEFYRDLLQFAAAQLRRDAANYAVQRGQENSASVIKAELNAKADKYERAAAALDSKASDRFASAAKIIVEIRDQIVGFAENHPELTKTFLELTSVVFGCYALHKIGGAQADVSAFVTYAVVRKEKLSEIIAAWGGKKSDDK
jgi:hypothetical protein